MRISPRFGLQMSSVNVRHGRVEPRYKPCTYALSRAHASAAPDFQEKALSFLSPCNLTRQFWLFGHVCREHFSRVMGSLASVLPFVGSFVVALLALRAVSACFGFGSVFFLGAALGALAALLGLSSFSLGSLRLFNLFCKCSWTCSAMRSTASPAGAGKARAAAASEACLSRRPASLQGVPLQAQFGSQHPFRDLSSPTNHILQCLGLPCFAWQKRARDLLQILFRAAALQLPCLVGTFLQILFRAVVPCSCRALGAGEPFRDLLEILHIPGCCFAATHVQASLAACSCVGIRVAPIPLAPRRPARGT